MPIGFEINDYDSNDDLSSTEDDNKDLPIFPIKTVKNKKIKSKRRDRTILKESKIIKDKAKQKIDNMVNELNDIEFFEYLKEKEDNKKEKKKKQKQEEDIKEFFTDDELTNQLKLYENLQKEAWSKRNFPHIHNSDLSKRQNVIRFGLMQKQKENRISRTKSLNTSSVVNTNINSNNPSNGFMRLGKMW